MAQNVRGLTEVDNLGSEQYRERERPAAARPGRSLALPVLLGTQTVSGSRNLVVVLAWHAV
jgi:hypothetical protein